MDNHRQPCTHKASPNLGGANGPNPNQVVFTSMEAALFLRFENLKHPDRAIERLCRAGKIKAQKASKRQGYKIHRKSLEDYLLLRS
jgi:hypothetical protein